jgi:phosphate transport system substrate-binding protein
LWRIRTHRAEKELSVKLNKWMVAAGIAALAVSMVALAGCSGGGSTGSTSASSSSGSALSGTINVSGSDTMVNMAGAWAQKFMTENPDVQIAVKGGGSGVGIAALLNKTTDVADASRKVKPEEAAQGATSGVNPVDTVVAKDGVTVIVNSANAVSDITTATLGKIYRGEITNWKDAGGADAPIVLLGRDSSSGTYSFINDEIIGKGKTYSKSMQSLQSNQAIVDQVGKDPNAIGYVGLGYDKPTIKVLTVSGVKASVASVLDASYPLSRDLNMYTNGEPTGATKAYIDWILGAEGQKIVADQGFVPLKQ